MSDLVDSVRKALSTVEDPDLHKDLVSLNMIRDLEVADGVAKFRLVLTTGACPVKKELEDRCRAAAESVEGIGSAEIEVDAEVPQGSDLREDLQDVRHIIAIASGKGGVGKSTVTANVACALAKSGARVGLLDADIYGPSTPLMMGINRKPHVANRKMIPLENHGVRMISMGFLVDEEAAMVWRGPMLQSAVKQFLTDVAWGELDYLIIDMPPGTGDVQMTLCQTVPLSGAVIVTTPQNVALLDARRGVTTFTRFETPVFGIVENMSQFICPKCSHSEPIFGEGGGETFADEAGVPFLGGIPLEPAVREAGDGGTPVVLAHPESASAQAFTALAERIAQQVSIHALKSAG